MTKSAGSYLHEGPIVIIPARVAAILVKHAPISKWRLEARTVDPELYNVLNELWVAGQLHNQSSGAPMPTLVRAKREWVTVQQAATILGLKDRGVRDACERRRLTAEKVAGRWHIDPESVRTYKAA